MRSSRTLCAAGISALLTFGGAGVALAADMLGAPPPPPPMMPPPAMEASSGFYLRGDIGASIYNHSRIDTLPSVASLRTIDSSINATGTFGVGAGYQFNSFLRSDVTVEYRVATRHRHVDSWTVPGNGGNLITGKIGGVVTLANAYVDLGTWHRITPFLGAGIGFSSMTMGRTNDTGLGVAAGSFASGPSKTTTQLAWALHAGLGYDLSANWKAEAAYRYLHIGSVNGGNVACGGGGPGCPYHVRIRNLDSHDLRVGLRYVFADMAPMLPPGPLVRKY